MTKMRFISKIKIIIKSKNQNFYKCNQIKHLKKIEQKLNKLNFFKLNIYNLRI